MDVLRYVRADAERRLSGALKTRKPKRISSAIREIVESSMPATRMPHERVRHSPKVAAGNPHVMWRWVSMTGLTNLVVEAFPDWKTLAVSVYVTRPGVSSRRERHYRQTTERPEQLAELVASALRAVGLSRPRVTL